MPSNPSLPDELNRLLTPYLNNGTVCLISEADPIKKIHERFPIVFGGIDWSKVPAGFNAGCYGMKGSKLDTESLKHTLDHFLQQTDWQPDAESIVIGDGVLDQAVVVPVHMLSALIEPLSKLPQHTYIIDPPCNWCFCYTMNDEVFYGPAPDPGRSS